MPGGFVPGGLVPGGFVPGGLVPGGFVPPLLLPLLLLPPLLFPLPLLSIIPWLPSVSRGSTRCWYCRPGEGPCRGGGLFFGSAGLLLSSSLPPQAVSIPDKMASASKFLFFIENSVCSLRLVDSG